MPTLTINAPSGAIVKINGTEQSSITAEAGTFAVWEVFDNEKGVRSGSLTLNEDATLDVKFVSGSFNINFLSQEAFDALETPEPNGIYAVECDPVIEFFPTKEDILTGVADGSSWYRIYKSGWVEQGGRVQTNNNIAPTNLLVPFISTAYSVQICNQTQAAFASPAGVDKTSEEYFSVRCVANALWMWEAKGYIGDIESEEQE